MNQPRVDLLRCPDCAGALDWKWEDNIPGVRCSSCGRIFYHEGRVLNLTPFEVARQTQGTVKQFGDSWSMHEYLAPYQERQFWDWIAPLKPEDFQGKTVLEAGCGKGRHSFLMAGYQPQALICIDLSDAILTAAEYTKAFPRVDCIRADLGKLPAQDGRYDVVICLGVLHHLEDPRAGLAELWRALKPGGTLCLWVYAREGNGWIVHLVDPLRKGITSRIPTKLLRPILLPLSMALYVALKLIYGPSTRRGSHPVGWLPYSTYLGYISRFPFREIEHIVLDHLCPPIAHYLSRPTLESWIADLNPREVRFRWHNRNSWNIVARKGAG